MKKELFEQEQKLTIGVLAFAFVAIVAQLALMVSIIKLISRGNKALKIYIDKNN